MNLQLSAYQAHRFKPFVNTGWLRIKPITLFFGHNSSGKSAILSVLPMLKQTIEDPDPSTPFVFASETGVDLGTFDEVVYQHQVSLEMPIWFDLELGGTKQVETASSWRYRQLPPQVLEMLGIKGDIIRVEIAAGYNKKRRRVAIRDFRMLDGEGNLILRTHRKTTAANQPWHIEPEPWKDRDLRPIWNHFLPRLLAAPHSPQIKSLNDLLMAVSNALTYDLRHLVHIGPLRDFPRRIYRLTGESPRDVGQSGENWLNILMQTRERGRLASQVNQWLDLLGYSLRIQWGRQGYVHPMLKDQSGLEVSLKDVGFGISQILPVLIQGFSSPPGTILILEQPEIHLHPRAQADLGDILLAIAQRGVRLLVETHSEHLLLRLRRRVAESSLNQQGQLLLNPEDMAIYFIERLEDRSQVYPVPMNELGEFIDPPERFQSFFSNDYEETVELSRTIARIAREASDASSD